MRTRVLAVGVALVVFASAARVEAQEANDKAAADVLFEQGRALLAEGKTEEACPKLAESLRLDPGIGTMLFLAECWQRAGKTASAWAQFREAEDTARKSGDAREKIAHDHVARLAPTLSMLSIRVPNPAPGTVVERDGHRVGDALWGTDVPIDPGPHTIRASAPGYKAWDGTVTVGANADHAVMIVPALVKAPVVAGERHEIVVTHGWQRILGGGLAVLGVTGLAIGTAYGLSAVAKNNRAVRDYCTGSACSQEGLDLTSTSRSDANVATIGIVAGTVLLVGGVVLFLTASRTETVGAL
jgi:hypothetical protein